MILKHAPLRVINLRRLMWLAESACNKTNGLFVGPLFGLFFMALFVKRATSFGTIIGAIYGFMTAFTFAYWDKITGAADSLSFQLIIPAALIAQILVGMLLSRLPIRKQGFFWGVVCLLPLAGFYLWIS